MIPPFSDMRSTYASFEHSIEPTNKIATPPSVIGIGGNIHGHPQAHFMAFRSPNSNDTRKEPPPPPEQQRSRVGQKSDQSHIF
jgi:hypothetical protein